jgi:glycosyltransferase involved in cell wall biosynthesis
MIRAATRVICVSEFTATEVEQLVHVPRERIRVVHNGVDPVFTPDGPRADGDYVLAVGTLEPRKNLQRTIEAAHLVGIELRIAGASGWGEVDPGTAWRGRVGDDELARLYRGARCVVYASLYEGFGIPVFEALACGTPVVTARGAAMAELADGAAVLVDPTDVASIAEGISAAMERTVGPVRRFDWDENARQTLEVYREAAG